MKATTESMVKLQETGSWARFVAILGAITILGTLVAATHFIWTGGRLWPDLEGAAKRFVVGGALLVNALMAVYPMAKLSLFADACGQCIVTKSFATLAYAMRQHRLFWRSWGILTVVAMTLNTLVALALWLS